MINAIFLNSIYNHLSKSGFFDKSDFSVIQDDSKTYGVELTIRYRYNTDFIFTIDFYRGAKNHDCKIRPGEIFDIDEFSVDMGGVLKHIEKWTERIESLLYQAPTFRHVLSLQEQVNDLDNELRKVVKDIDDDFNSHELRELAKKLDEVEAELTNKLQEQHQETETLQADMRRLQKDFEILKNQASVLDKRNWLLSFYTKAYLWGQNNPKLITKTLMEVGYTFLPESAKEHFPIDTATALISPPEESTKQPGHS
ncbi:hypothetical protein [Rossellomorea marisflavi]|uniref:hypothetical protein n=1 Tax=Rossellomorea marisflavi TaxID=189381 RepID=UPI00064F9640|nr:hypothetical protein [Rossellomorea marisflavi]KMK93735.1 hypothetical protein VL03_12765 [Rossellomorea marisflavi]